MSRVIQSKSVTALILVVAVCLIAAVAYFVQPPVDSDQSGSAAISMPDKLPVQLESRLVFFGDVMWGRRNQVLAEQNGGPEYLFEQLATLNREAYDAWIVNLECPVTDTVIPMQQQENQLLFNCPPEYLDTASEWFDIISLANNHTDNVDGETGLIETREKLDQAGIQYFGHYDNAVTQDVCEVVALPARTLDINRAASKVSLPVALCGYHGVFKLITEAELAIMNEFSKYMPVIAMPHMGAEYEPSSDDIREGQFRAMIDNGADIVVGGHPHWVQNTEVYRGKLIVYSLGNFLFDQAWSEEVQRGIGLEVDILVPYDDNLQQWIDLGESCQAFKDTCLAHARTAGLTEPSVQFEFGIVGTQYIDGQTAKADQTTQRLLLERTNWADTLDKLAR